MASASDPALTAAFTAVLRRQELIALIVAVPALAWLSCGGGGEGRPRAVGAEVADGAWIELLHE